MCAWSVGASCGRVCVGRGRLTEAKRKRQGLVVSRGFALRGPFEMRAPVSRSRARLGWAAGLPVVEAFGGRRARPGERVRASRHGCSCCGPGARGPGPSVMGRRRRARAGVPCGARAMAAVGVVLLAPEQTPDQAGELAAGRDGGDLRPTASANALVERAQRARRSNRAPCGLDEHVTDWRLALLGDVPVASGGRSEPAHAGINADVADQASCAAEAVDVADRADERTCGDDADAQDGHQP